MTLYFDADSLGAYCRAALSTAELGCVFHRQIREKRLTGDPASQWREQFRQDVRNGVWLLFPVSDILLDRVEALVGGLAPEVYLRAGDAIHLTSARDAGFSEIWSNHRRLLAAAPHFGLRGRSV